MDIRRENIEKTDSKMPIHCDIAKGLLSTDLHLHDEMEIVYIIEGSTTYFIKGDAIEVKENEIIIVSSMVPHSTKENPNLNTRICNLQFRPDLFMRSRTDCEYLYLSTFISDNIREYYKINVVDNEAFKDLPKLLLEISHELYHKNTAYELTIKSNIYRILALLFRFDIANVRSMQTLCEEEHAMQNLRPVFKFVEEHFSEPITTQQASKLTNYAYQYFCKIFKETTGKSFIQYLNFIRTNAADRMLLTTQDSISDIYIKSGFSSFSYFNRVFKKFKGCSPSEYRKLNMQNNSLSDKEK